MTTYAKPNTREQRAKRAIKPESIRKDCEFCGKPRSAHKRILIMSVHAWACRMCCGAVPRAMLVLALKEIAALQADLLGVFNIVDKHSGQHMPTTHKERLEATLQYMHSMGTERFAFENLDEDMSERDAIEVLGDMITPLKALVKHYGCYGASAEHWEADEGKAFSRDVATLTRAIKIIEAGGAGQLYKLNHCQLYKLNR